MFPSIFTELEALPYCHATVVWETTFYETSVTSRALKHAWYVQANQSQRNPFNRLVFLNKLEYSE